MIDELPVIRRRAFERPARHKVQELEGTPTGFVVDALGGTGALDYRIKAAIPEFSHFCGIALTCDAGPADNLALIHALADLKPGDVLVANAHGHRACAITGDLLLGMARNSGAVGFVTDGCVRDLPGIRKVGLPAFCVGVTPNSPNRSGPGTVGFPIMLAGQLVCSGDVVIADQDGVVVVPQALLEETLERLDGIRAAEARADQSVREGARLPAFFKR